MRPLNRPMFRNGGPIKEGIMDGMKDRAALVGNPGFPTQGGRGMYAEQLSLFDAVKQAGKQTVSNITKKPLNVLNPAKKAGFIANLFKRGAGPVKNFYQKQIKKLDMPKDRIPSNTGMGGVQLTEGQIAAGMGTKQAGIFNKALQFARANPKTTIGGGYLASGPVVDVATGGVPLVKKGLMQVGDLLVPDFIFDQDKYLADKAIAEANAKNKKTTETGTGTGTGTDTDTGTGTSGIDRDAEIEANRKRYYKLMGIDKLNKDAVYNTLIDASNQIREGGTMKDQIKSGNLVSGVINSLSQNLDKSVDLKKQIDAAILKAEITKDVNREKDQLDAEYKKLAIDKLQNEAAGGTMKQILFERANKGIVTSGRDLFTLAKQTGMGDDIKQILPEKQVSNFLKDNPDKTAVDFLQSVDLNLQEQQGEGLDAGDYVVGSNIVTVDANGNIKLKI